MASRKVRVYWAWSTGDRWVAAHGAKSAFAGTRHLYKIQLSTTVLSTGSMATPDAPDDACGRFLKDFLPAARPYLAATPVERTP